MEKELIKKWLICKNEANCTFDENFLYENNTLLKVNTSFLSKLDIWQDFIVAIFLLTVGVASTVLNGLVVYVCIRKVKTLVSCDVYILNLAIIDMIMPVFGFPLTIYSSLNHQWMFDKVFCAAYGFICFFCGVVSIATLAVISYARYIKVCGVKRGDSILLHTKASLICIYCYAGFWALLPLFGVGAYGPEPYGTSCTLAWQGYPIFVTFFLIGCVLLPVVIMNLSYGKIIWTTKKARRKASVGTRKSGPTLKKRDAFFIKMTFSMCVGFVGLWCPYAVVSLWTAYGCEGEVPVRLTLVAVLFAKLSTIINPILYVMLNKKFRPFLKKMFL
ncbi:opsin-5-like [Mytilus californianus]|uniref:opsin-5-like n=1 Tax=Mytilus californianus TaxID=6549 RepID=UPI0022481513|nr:opsin-5-like [Mytilus californianus]